MSTVPITPSTSVVLINVDDYAPNDPVVLFGKDAAYGKLVTVRDKAGTATSTNSIYISTSADAMFSSDVGSDYFTIDQAYGSATLMYKGENPETGLGEWAIVNTFAYPGATDYATFRESYVSTLTVADGRFIYEYDGANVLELSSATFNLSADILMNGFDISGAGYIYTTNIDTEYISAATAEINELTVESTIAEYIDAQVISTIDLYAESFSTIDGEIKDLQASTIWASDLIETEIISTVDLYADYSSTNTADINYLTVESTIAEYIDATTISTIDLYAESFSTIDGEIKDLLASTIWASDLIETDRLSTVDLYADYSSTNTADINYLTVESTIAEYINATSISTIYMTADEISTIDAEIKDLITSTIYATDLIETEYISTFDLVSYNFSTFHGEIKDLEASTITADFLDIDAISTTRLGADFISSFAISTFSLKADRVTVSSVLNVRSSIVTPNFYTSSILLQETNGTTFTPIANQHRITVSSGFARLNNQDIYVIPRLISTHNLFLSSINTSTIVMRDITTGTREIIESKNDELYYNNSTIQIAAPFFSTVGYIASTITASTMSTVRLFTNTISTTSNIFVGGNSLLTGWTSTTTLMASNVSVATTVVTPALSTSIISTNSLFGNMVSTASNFTHTLAVNTVTPLAGFLMDVSGNAFIRTLYISTLFASTQQVTGTELGRLGINCNAPRDIPYFYHLDVNGNAHVASNFYTSSIFTSTAFVSSSLQVGDISTVFIRATNISTNTISTNSVIGSTIALTTSITAPWVSTANISTASILGSTISLTNSLTTPFLSTINISTLSLRTQDLSATNLAFLNRAQISTLNVSSMNALSAVTSTLTAFASMGTISTFTSSLHVASNLNVGNGFIRMNVMDNRVGIGNTTTRVEISGNYIRHNAQLSNILATPNVTMFQNNTGANIEIYEGTTTAPTKNATFTVTRTAGTSTKFYSEDVQTNTGLRVGQGFLGGNGTIPNTYGIQYGANTDATTGIYMSSGIGINTRQNMVAGAALTVNGQTNLSTTVIENTGLPLRIFGPGSNNVNNSSTIIQFTRVRDNGQSAFMGHCNIASDNFMVQTTQTGSDLILGTTNYQSGVYIQDSTKNVGIGITTPQYGLHVVGSMFASTISTTNLFTSSLHMVADTSGIYQGMYLSSGRLMLDNRALAFTTDTNSNTGALSNIPLNLSANTLLISTISTQQLFTSTLTANGLTTLINQPTLRRWVGVGEGGTGIEYSDNLSIWTSAANSYTQPINTVIYDGSKYILGANTIATSTDGTSWANIASPPTFTTCFALATDGRTYLAGCSGTNKILRSANGTSWSAVTTSVFGTSCLGIATNGRIWAAVGEGTNTLALSTDNGLNWTGRGTSIFSTAGRCIAYNGTMWMAGGEGTNTLAYSFDASNWTAVSGSTSVFGTACRGVAWNGSMWVAVGNGTNNIAYSFDGLSWIGLGDQFGSTGTGYSITWNGSLWLAAGQGTKNIYTSPNGITWTSRDSTFATSGRSYAFSSNITPDLQMSNFGIYSQGVPNYTTSTNQLLITSTTTVLNNSLFVNNATNNVGINVLPSAGIALDVNGNLRASNQAILSSISTNLVSSMFLNTSNLTTTIANSRILNTSSIFASTILASSITTSTINTSTLLTNNLLTSSLNTSSIGAFQFTTSHISANSAFVSSIASFSTTTTSFTASYMSSIGLVTSSMGIGTNAPQFLLDVNGSARMASLSTSIISTQAIQTSSISTSFIYSSTIVASNFSTTFLQASNISSSQIFVSSLQANYISTPFAHIGGLSTSIISTQAIQTSSISTTFIYTSSMTASNISTNLFRANNVSTAQILTSSVNANFISSQMAQISTLSTTLIYTSTIATMLMSTVRFEAGELAFNTGSFTNLAVSGSGTISNNWSSNVIVAGGTGGTFTISYSTDNGSNWTGGNNTIATSVNAVVWDGTRFIAGGENNSTSVKVMTSANGTSWDSISTYIMTTIYDVAYNGRMYVMVGTGGGSIQTNTSGPSGTSWTGWNTRTGLSVGYGVAWNGSLWVAVGQRDSGGSTIVYSTDGATWTNATDIFSTRGRKVAWNGIYWIAVGEGTNNLARSTDGITWTGVTVTGLTIGYDVAWNGTVWVIGGQTSTSTPIYYSYDGVNWTGVSGIFSGITGTNGFGVTWAGRQFVATATGTNVYATSPDGVTWTGRGSLTGVTSGYSIGYSQITTSDFILPNLNIYSRNTPNYLLSTNQILVQENSMTLNHALTVNKETDFVGIRNGNPTSALDVNGVISIAGGEASSAYGSIPQTYMTLGQNGSGTDFVSIRQIGGDNQITLAYDFYDNQGDTRFVLRNNPSVTTPGPWEVMRVDNDTTGTGSGGTLQITQFSTLTGTTTPALSLRNNSRPSPSTLNMYTALTAGGYNSITQAGDKGIIFTDGSVDTGNLVIAPHANGTKGIRMNSSGQVGIGVASPGTTLDISGTGTNIGVRSARYYLDAPGDNQDTVGTTDNKGGPWYGLGWSAISGATGKPCLAGYGGVAMRSSDGYIYLAQNGNVGIGTADPLNPLHVQGTQRIIQFTTATATAGSALLLQNAPSSRNITFYTNLTAGAYNSITQAGDTGLMFSGGSVDTGNLVIAPHANGTKGIRITSGGNVGIGNTNPTGTLTVSSDPPYAVSGASGTNWGEDNSVPQLMLTSATNANKRLALGYNTVTDAGAIQALDFTTGYKRLLLNPIAGNVGIGTTNPLATLDVNGAIIARGGTSTSGSTATNTYITYTENGSSTDWIHVRQIGGNNNITLSHDFHDDIGDVRFVVRSVPSATGGGPWEVLRVDNNHDGTGAEGTMQVTQFSNANTVQVPALSLRNSPSSHVINFYPNARAGDYNSIVQANDKSIIFTTGTQGQGNLVIAPWSTTGVTSGLRMTSAGNVGIGTTNPGATLDVNGSLNVTGTFNIVPAGCIMMYVNSAPSGWLLCDGTAISRSTYSVLFQVIGTQFGPGNGTTTFNLPDFRGRAPIGSGSGTGLTNRVLATTGGSETHTLTTNEMPSHNHTSYFGVAGYGSPGGWNLTSVGGNAVNTDSKGGGAAHNNMQPFLVVNYIIKT